jgi:hypothetical protein
VTAASTLLRFGLLVAALAIAVALIAAHGVRGLAIVVAIGLIVTLPQTKAWQRVEGVLVRITGSRKRAAGLALFVVIAVAGGIQVYGLFG